MHLISVLMIPGLLSSVLGCSDYRLKGEGNNGNGGRDSGYEWDDSGDVNDDVCDDADLSPTEVGLSDHCYTGDGSFTPVVEWDWGGGSGCTAQPAVGDLDGDGLPEILINTSALSFPGELTALHGDGSGELWTVNAQIAYGSGATLADVDDDGSPEIFYAKEYEQSLFADGDYTVVALDATGAEVWESEHFIGLATATYWSNPRIWEQVGYGGPPDLSALTGAIGADR